jgi:hypothetical protein
VLISPSSQFIVSICVSRVTVRETISLTVVHVFQAVDKIDKVEFSPDSQYLLCALYSRNSIQVFSLIDKDWKCRINEGAAGMVNSFWSPDSRKVAVESDFGIQLAFWSLVDSTSTVISYPKAAYPGIASQMASFSDDGNYLAVIHRIELQDFIGVYSAEPLAELTKFKSRSNDICSVTWVPSSTHLVTVDSPLNYKVCVYMPSGEVKKTQPRISFFVIRLQFDNRCGSIVCNSVWPFLWLTSMLLELGVSRYVGLRVTWLLTRLRFLPLLVPYLQ